MTTETDDHECPPQRVIELGADVDHAVALLDDMLGRTTQRENFGADEVSDLCLDVRNILTGATT